MTLSRHKIYGVHSIVLYFLPNVIPSLSNLGREYTNKATTLKRKAGVLDVLKCRCSSSVQDPEHVLFVN